MIGFIIFAICMLVVGVIGLVAHIHYSKRNDINGFTGFCVSYLAFYVGFGMSLSVFLILIIKACV